MSNNAAITASRAAGEVLLKLTALLESSGVDVALWLDLDNARAVYEVFKSVTKLGTWHTSWEVTLDALKSEGESVMFPISIATELRRSFDEWCAIKQAKEQA